MPDENTFKSAFADANCPKETRSYTLAHLKEDFEKTCFL